MDADDDETEDEVPEDEEIWYFIQSEIQQMNLDDAVIVGDR